MEVTKRLAEALNRWVRPATFPIGVSVIEGGALPEKTRTPLKHFNTRMTLCQGFSIARRFGFTMGFNPEDHQCPIALVAFGLKTESKLLEGGAMAFPLYAATPEVGVRLNVTLRLSYNQDRKFLIFNLESATQLPDAVMVYGNPAQINRLVLAVAYMTGEAVRSEFLGRGSCIQSIIAVGQSHDYRIILPGVGERALALAGDDEMIFSIPRTKFAEITSGLEGSQKAGGFRFPTIFPALLREPPFHPSYEPVFKELGLK